MKFCCRSTIPMNVDDIKFIVNKLKRMVDTRKSRVYTFSKYNIHDLERNQYLLTFKTTGSRFFLILTTIMGKKFSLFVQCDNPYNLKVFNVKLRFNTELYSDTIIDGELLLNDKENWIFMCNNILYNKGIFVGNKMLGYRISIMADILRNQYKYDDFLNNCHLQLRSYFLYNHLEMLTNTHNNELLLVPERPDKPILSFVIKNLAKNEKIITQLSSNLENILEKDFYVEKTKVPDVFELYNENYIKNKIKKEQSFRGIACISRKSHSFYMKKIFDKNENGVWIKFKYNTELKGWEPKI